MEFDLNSSINFTNTPKIPRSRSSAPKSQDGGFKIDKRLEFNHDFKNGFNTPGKSNQESKIQTRPLIDIEIGKSSKKMIKTISDKKLYLGDEREFDFDHIYSDSTSNLEVFEKSVKSNITRALEGYNFSIMAYGQTGSGKTYTVGTNQAKNQSDKECQQNKGIIQHSIEHIFKSIKNKSGLMPINSLRSLLDESITTANNNADSTKNTNALNNSFTQDNDNPKYEYIVKASFVEIYNEEIIDLLNIKTPSKHIIIRNINNLTTLSGVSLINVNEPEDCYQLLNSGINNRKTSSTNMNEKSSRSHAIFTLYFEKISISQNLNESGTGFNNLNANNIPINFKINFIDLAGSERLKKSGATGDRFKESVSINSGLLALSKVIMALSENNSKVHIPYRDSKLTRILKDSLNGASITLILACVSPSDYNYEETLNTLNYASFAKSIKVNPLINFNIGNIGGAGNNQKYEEIINKLKNENFLLAKQVEDLRNCENKENEILRLKNVIKTLKRKMILKNDPAANYKEIPNKKASEINLNDIDEDIKMSEIDRDSFLNISELINEEDNLEGDIKEKFNDELESNSNNKNEYEYIVRIKENNMLKRENEELKNRLNKLLKEQNGIKNRLSVSPSYLNFDNVENDINSKLPDLDNLIDLNDKNRDGLENPDYKTTKKNNMDTELSIKDLKAMEIDENKLEEESNFLLNYDNDMIIAQLSESLVNKKEIENFDYNKDNRADIKGINNEINHTPGPVFNKLINNFENENLHEEEDLLDVNKSIKFNNLDNPLINFNQEIKINPNDDLKTMISKEKMHKDDKTRNNSYTPSNKNSNAKIPSYKYYDGVKKDSNNNYIQSMNYSLISHTSLNRKSSKINNTFLTRNEKKKLEPNSNTNLSSNNCSQEKSNFMQIKTLSNRNPINNKASMENVNSKVSENRKSNNQSSIHNRTLNNTLNTSNFSDINKLKLQQNVALISEKIVKLRDYQGKLKEKIIEAEIQKNRILKNKNEEISYMKRNVDDKQKVLKNLHLINERNQKIIERSEHTINNLKIELRNKSMEIRSLQSDNSTTKSINFGNTISSSGNNNSNLRSSYVFSVWNKHGKDVSGGCCGGAGHSKNLSHSMNNKASHCSLIKGRKFGNFGFKDETRLSQKNIQASQAFSPSLSKSNTKNLFSFNSKSKEKINKLIYPDTSKENLFKTSNIFSTKKKSNELNSSKYNDPIINNTIKPYNYDTKTKTEIENFNDDKKIVHRLKFVLLDLENLFLEKNKCQKRMKNLQMDKKEIIQLKKQNIERYNSRLKALMSAKNRLDNILKQEEHLNNLNNSGATKMQNSFHSKLNTFSNFENNNANLNSNLNHYPILATTPDNPMRSSCEKKSDYNTNGSSANLKAASGLNNYLNTSPNLNVSDKSFKMNANTGNIKIENVNNSTSISNSIAANTNNYNQNIQKLTAIIYKISAVNERIERMNNLHESTLSEINLSEEILVKQMKNIEASINRIKMQLTNPDFQTAKKDFDDSIEDLRKEFCENNFVTLSNNNNNNIIFNKNENPDIIQNNTEFNEIENTANNTVANMISNLNANVNINDNNLSLNAENNKKVEKLFEKIYEMKKLLEHKDKKIKDFETENSNKEKLIQDLQKKIDNNINKGYLYKQISDDTNYNLNRNRNNFKNENNRIKDEDYYCNYGNGKNITLENSQSKKEKSENLLARENKNNNYVNINNTIYNISLTPQKVNSVNPSLEKKPSSMKKYRLPPTNKKKL